MRRPPTTPTAPRFGVARALRHALGAAVLLAVALLPILARPAPVLAQTPTATAPPSIVGIYTVAIGQPDLPPGLPGSAALLGLWTINFAGDGTYTMARQDVGDLASGTYSVEGRTLTLHDWNGLIGCGTAVEPDTTGSYAWDKSDDTLNLTAITDACPERRLLLTTRTFARFEACATSPLSGLPPIDDAAALATPVAGSGVAQQEGLPREADPEAAIDELLRQATGCWATGDPARFLPLHSPELLAELGVIIPLPEFARDLALFMSTPVSFKRIGAVNMIDPTHAWAYVEITIGGEALPQRIDFVLENGVWLFDTFFLLGPPPSPEESVSPAQ